MKTPVLFIAAALAVSAVQTSAMTTVADADANGVYSMDEIVASYPELTADAFAEMDLDESGDISEEELAAASENGILGN